MSRLRHHLLASAIAFAAFAAFGGASGPAAGAGMDARKVLIAAKAFDFVRTKPSPGAAVVVIRGAAQPDAVQAALRRFRIVEGSVNDVAGAYAVFVNSSTEARDAHSRNAGVLIVGADVGCVNDGACVLAVETQPRVSVFVSHAAAAGAGIAFDTSFLMLITER